MGFIVRLGGLPDLARDLGVKTAAILPWRHRGIPHWRLPEVVEIARGKGVAVTIEELMALKGPETRGGARPRDGVPAEAA